LFAQISNGAPFDVFMSADLGYPQKLAEAGEAAVETLRPYARGTLVLLMSKSWKDRAGKAFPTLQGLTDASVAHIAIANPVHAPYGRAADAALRKAGIIEQVRPKLVVAENISQAAQFVASGNADAGLVALTAVISDKDAAGRWQEVPRDLYPPIDQGAIVTRVGKQNPASQEFINFLSTPEAKSVLKRYGFAEVPPQSVK
jgi:molybdate transport system substrate-binding protein